VHVKNIGALILHHEKYQNNNNNNNRVVARPIHFFQNLKSANFTTKHEQREKYGRGRRSRFHRKGNVFEIGKTKS